MSLIQRLRTVTLAYGNNLLDKTIDMNSLPMVRQYIRDLEDAIDKTAHEAAVAAANVTILQQQIDTNTRTTAADTDRAKAFLAKGDQTSARLVAGRIHDNNVLLESLKEQIAAATQNSTQMDTTLEQLRSRHTEAMNNLRRLEGEDRQARNMEGANKSLKEASAVLGDGNSVNDSINNMSAKIHQRNVVANEEFHRTVASMQPAPDPVRDSAVDEILAGLKPEPEPEPAATAAA